MSNSRPTSRSISPYKYDNLVAPRVVIIGGGSGTAAIYGKIAAWTPNVTAIVAMTDSGGSTGRLRDELGITAVGDVRHILATTTPNADWKKIEKHRFGGEGPLKGHHVINVLLSALVAEFGPAEGTRMASRMLQVPGTVLPVTLDNTQLKMQDGDDIIIGEGKIDVYAPKTAEPHISIELPATLSQEAANALQSADLIVIPAGSIYTSLLAALTVPGVAKIMRVSRAQIVMLCNLATEQHQTDEWDVADFVKALRRHNIRIDIVLYNTKQPTSEMLENYASDGQRPVEIHPDRFGAFPTVRFIGVPLLSRDMEPPNPLDPVKRGLMRHDPTKVVAALQQILRDRRARK